MNARPTRDEAVRDAGTALADALDQLDATPPREAAEKSNAVTSGRASVEDIEDRIRASRGLPALERDRGAA